MKRMQWWLVAANLVLLACSFVPLARAGDISVEGRQKRAVVVKLAQAVKADGI